MLATINTTEVREKAMPLGESVRRHPVNPITVANIVPVDIFSFKKIFAIKIVNKGTVKLIRVTVEIGTNLIP